MSIAIESVAPGHPDKIADYLSDVVLDTYKKHDPNHRAAIETVVYSDGIFITGEVTRLAVDVSDEIRERVVLALIKIYGDYRDNWLDGLIDSPKNKITLKLNQQSEELAHLSSGDRMKSGDQGVIIGYATNESYTYLPIAFSISKKIMKKMASLRLSGELPGNCPDGKCLIVTGEEDNRSIDEIYLTMQYESREHFIKSDAKSKICDVVNEEVSLHYKRKIKIEPYINVNFRNGGPLADTGLTGRKPIVDSYGPTVFFGGGAYSGKDITKVDRLCAYYARWMAKHIVASGLAERCYIHYSVFVGRETPLKVTIDCLNSEHVPLKRVIDRLKAIFSSDYSDMIKDLNLTGFLYERTSLFGHFTEWDMPWEILDTERVAQLKELMLKIV